MKQITAEVKRIIFATKSGRNLVSSIDLRLKTDYVI